MQNKAAKISLFFLIFTASACTAFYVYSLKNLPPMDTFKAPARHAELIGILYQLPSEQQQYVEPCDYNELPQILIDVFLASFNSTYFTKSSFEKHDSAIPTTVLARALAPRFNNREIGPLLNKAAYFCVYYTITSTLDKKQILSVYLNTMRLHGNIFGVGAGARHLFNKNVVELSLSECALLMAIHRFAGRSQHPELPRLQEVRNWTLGKLLKSNKISDAAYEKAMNEPIFVPGLMVN